MTRIWHRNWRSWRDRTDRGDRSAVDHRRHPRPLEDRGRQGRAPAARRSISSRSSRASSTSSRSRRAMKGVAVASYVDPQVPAGVEGDSRLLRQVLVNLAGNAVKFTDSGEVVVRAERPALARVAGARALQRQRHRRRGSPPDAIETLFEPFTQVDGSSSRAARRQRPRARDLLAARAADGRQARGRIEGRAAARRSRSRCRSRCRRSRSRSCCRRRPTSAARCGCSSSMRPTPRPRPSSATCARGGWCRHACRPRRSRASASRRRRAAERFDVAIVAATAGDEDAQRLARELHARGRRARASS